MIARNITRAGLTHGCLALVCGLLALPYFWMVITALKTPESVSLYPPAWWPSPLHWSNFVEAWNAAPFGRFYLNSLLTGVAATALQISFAILMAYAFAVIPFPRKDALFLVVLATMMIPDEMKLIPNFLLLDRLGWIDTYWALIIPPAAHAFPVFVLRQQFLAVPRSLIDAAKVDGAGHARILVSVVLPISSPVVAAATLVAFLGRWNDYLWPLVVTNREAIRTLPVGLAYLQGSQEGGLQWQLLMAASIFVMIPGLALFVAAQRLFIDGITRGALKG